jgi:hypothetical protein
MLISGHPDLRVGSFLDVADSIQFSRALQGSSTQIHERLALWGRNP